jgi:hypothetical protein
MTGTQKVPYCRRDENWVSPSPIQYASHGFYRQFVDLLSFVWSDCDTSETICYKNKSTSAYEAK